jgi:hypothetical protein
MSTRGAHDARLRNKGRASSDTGPSRDLYARRTTSLPRLLVLFSHARKRSMPLGSLYDLARAFLYQGSRRYQRCRGAAPKSKPPDTAW